MRVRVRRASSFAGTVEVPGDKSISHRALVFAALGDSPLALEHLAPGADVRSTAACLEALGVERTAGGSGALLVRGRGALLPPSRTLDCGNSGTTMRLLSGLVAGSGVVATLDGDASLRRRPMARVLAPLRAMGANAAGTATLKDEFAPLHFSGGALLGRAHQLTVASAQVKSCLVLAGLQAEGVTSIREPQPSRDHTERMLRAFGAPLRVASDGTLWVERLLRPLALPARLRVPGDPSSAAFFVGAAVLVPNGSVACTRVDVNATRTGFLRVLARMGAEVRLEPGPEEAGDPVATVHVRAGATLKATTIHPAEVPSLLDEVPLLAVVASQAEGVTRLSGAAELRVKESDRLRQVCQALRAMGAEVEETQDGFAVHGPARLKGAYLDAAGDHRIAMAFAVAGLIADGETTLEGAEWADISYPGFFTELRECAAGAVQL
ncbi:MAG: 3-phosphoshikimate 1-carboxyvinyltransferase [Myxococcaceae bacterium]